jgi:sulfur transfer complex TusBCD TusB component (DsrH family)
MALYIFDKPFFENGAPYVQMDEEAKILLLHDALYVDLEKLSGKEIYVIQEELDLRGLGKLLPESVKKVDYAAAIDLIADNRVINFT